MADTGTQTEPVRGEPDGVTGGAGGAGPGNAGGAGNSGNAGGAGNAGSAGPGNAGIAGNAEEGPGTRRRKIGEGPGRLIVSLYGLFTVAAGSRSIYQLIAQYDKAPLAYILSAVAAVVYAFILVTLVRGGESARRIGIACCALELAGVLVVGTLTIVEPSLFRDQTVWSYYGVDYLLIPLVLPITGIVWLRRAGAGPAGSTGGTDGPRNA